MASILHRMRLPLMAASLLALLAAMWAGLLRLGWFTVRQWGGMLNVLAVLVFMFFTARAVITARSQVVRS